MDVVLHDVGTGRALVVLDTKYKSTEQPSNADIFQIAFYARELNVRRAILVYPSAVSNPVKVRHAGGVEVESAVFDISLAPDHGGAAFLKALGETRSAAAQFATLDRSATIGAI